MPSRSIYLTTTKKVDVISVTHDISRFLKETNVQDGIIVVLSPDPGAGVTIIESLPAVVDQLKEAFAVFPGADATTLSKRKEQIPVAPRVRAALLGRSISIPVFQGKLAISPREEVVVVDFEDTAKRRNVIVHLTGFAPKEQPKQPPRRGA